MTDVSTSLRTLPERCSDLASEDKAMLHRAADLFEALEPFVKAARLIEGRPNNYANRIAMIGGLENAADLMKEHFADLLSAYQASTASGSPIDRRAADVGAAQTPLGLLQRVTNILLVRGTYHSGTWAQNEAAALEAARDVIEMVQDEDCALAASLNSHGEFIAAEIRRRAKSSQAQRLPNPPAHSKTE